MRKVTAVTKSAFLEGRNLKVGNTKAVYHEGIKQSVLSLHGNVIATLDHVTKRLRIYDGGWQSNTTKERLNALPNVSIVQRNWVWYLNGVEWNSAIKEIQI